VRSKPVLLNESTGLQEYLDETRDVCNLPGRCRRVTFSNIFALAVRRLNACVTSWNSREIFISAEGKFSQSVNNWGATVHTISSTWTSNKITSLKAHFHSRKFSRTENFPKISLLKVEHFQFQNFFPTENLCRSMTFYKKFSFSGKFSWVEMDLYG
jgi:hypothetical protein